MYVYNNITTTTNLLLFHPPFPSRLKFHSSENLNVLYNMFTFVYFVILLDIVQISLDRGSREWMQFGYCVSKNRLIVVSRRRAILPTGVFAWIVVFALLVFEHFFHIFITLLFHQVACVNCSIGCGVKFRMFTSVFGMIPGIFTAMSWMMGWLPWSWVDDEYINWEYDPWILFTISIGWACRIICLHICMRHISKREEWKKEHYSCIRQLESDFSFSPNTLTHTFIHTHTRT